MKLSIAKLSTLYLCLKKIYTEGCVVLVKVFFVARLTALKLCVSLKTDKRNLVQTLDLSFCV